MFLLCAVIVNDCFGCVPSLFFFPPMSPGGKGPTRPHVTCKSHTFSGLWRSAFLFKNAGGKQSECNVEKEKYGRRYTKLGKTLFVFPNAFLVKSLCYFEWYLLAKFCEIL